MFAKYNDTPAAITIGVVTLFFIIQVVLFAFTAEIFLEDAGIDPVALPMAYWMCFLFATLAIGLILTFVKGPDGQSIFFNVMLIGQIGGVVGSLIEIATDTATNCVSDGNNQWEERLVRDFGRRNPTVSGEN